jgi:TATA-binding protein-associated factor
VQAVAAEALMPAAAALAGEGAPAEGARVLRLLWGALDVLDQLSPAAAALLALLASVHSACPGAAAAAGVEGPLPPRLWPFLGHGLAAVRCAALRCLSALLGGQPASAALPGGELARALRLLFQALLAERSAEVLAAAQHAWRLLVARAQPRELAAAAASPVQAEGGGVAAAAPPPLLGALFRLGATPPRSPLDASLLLRVQPQRGSRAGAGAGRAGRGGSAAQQAAGGAEAAAAAAAAARQEEGLVVEGDGDAERTTRMRLAAAQALGQLAHALSGGAPPPSPHPALAPAEALLRGPSASGRLLAAHAVACWAEAAAGGGGEGGGAGALEQLRGVLLDVLAQPAPPPPRYSELAPLAAQLRGQASALLSRALAASLALDMPCPLAALGPVAAAALAAQVPQGAPAELALAAQALAATAAVLQTSEALLHTSAAAAAAAAVVRLASLPPKLNCLIQPLVAAVRREPQPALQDAAAEALARLALLCAQRTPCPNDK